MAGRRIEVLVVDDSAAVRRALEHQLERGGLGVRTVATASDALRACADRRPDVALVDLDLAAPGDGVGVARRIRSLDRTTAVVLLSSAAPDRRAAATLFSGAATHVAKAVNRIGQLTDIIKDIAGGRAAPGASPMPGDDDLSSSGLIDHVRAGMVDDEIAEIIGVSVDEAHQRVVALAAAIDGELRRRAPSPTIS